MPWQRSILCSSTITDTVTSTISLHWQQAIDWGDVKITVRDYWWRQLHWLPVSSRIQFKLCTLTFDINRGTAPQYLSELVRHCDNTWLLSNVRRNFVVSCTRLHVTDKAFSIAGAYAWNALPSNMKLISSRTIFCKKLKTLFQSHLVETY